MFDKLLGLTAPDRVSEAFMWRWATEHPVLHTIIEVTNQPYFLVAVVFVGYHVIRRMVRR
ncbi:hypothetical protein [Paenibacillus planticolens]|uniref:Uncharacterized protein n=1 Tax=Paenibacillus planticolens TaxID=2654976 RepID=A0ABX1ZEA9_9BACL|nr:hypothetical protein [Paenibacillus planticolens]NOU98426.1 hypothetical protein [Paenibacillus planticolens]